MKDVKSCETCSNELTIENKDDARVPYYYELKRYYPPKETTYTKSSGGFSVSYYCSMRCIELYPCKKLTSSPKEDKCDFCNEKSPVREFKIDEPEGVQIFCSMECLNNKYLKG